MLRDSAVFKRTALQFVAVSVVVFALHACGGGGGGGSTGSGGSDSLIGQASSYAQITSSGYSSINSVLNSSTNLFSPSRSRQRAKNRSACPDVYFSSIGNIQYVILDYGSGCYDPFDGAYYRGKIGYFQSSLTLYFYYDDFVFSDGDTFFMTDGTLSAYYATSSSGIPQQIELDLKILKGTQDLSCFVGVSVDGTALLTSRGTYLLSGSGSVVTPSVEVSSYISELEINPNCPYPVAGQEWFTINGIPVYVNYNTGQCSTARVWFGNLPPTTVNLRSVTPLDPCG